MRLDGDAKALAAANFHFIALSLIELKLIGKLIMKEFQFARPIMSITVLVKIKTRNIW